MAGTTQYPLCLVRISSTRTAVLLQWSFFGLPASCCDILVEDCISRWLLERCTSCPLCNDCIKMLDPQMWCRRRCHISVPSTDCPAKSEQHHPIFIDIGDGMLPRSQAFEVLRGGYMSQGLSRCHPQTWLVEVCHQRQIQQVIYTSVTIARERVSTGNLPVTRHLVEIC